jgi:hypothetical protein
MLVRMLIVMTLILSLAISMTAQTPAAPSDKASAKIRTKVEKLRVGHKITVKLKNGDDYHGAISKINDTNFEVVEVDLRQTVSFAYWEVKKVRGAYGSKNIFGQRIKPKTGAIVGVGVLGGLLALILLSIPKT